MSKELALTLLAQGGNGNEILQILDSLVEDLAEATDTDKDVDF